MAVTASLGRWQLSRATQKETLQAAMDARRAEAPLDAAQFLRELAALPALDEKAQAEATRNPLLHRQVSLTGEWLADKTVFLDNRQMQGKQGFYVFTPLRLSAAGQPIVMVQRGWAARNFEDRTRLPEVPSATGEVQLTGRVAAHPARLYEFSPSAQDAGSSRIRQNLDLAAFGAESGLALLPLTVVQTSAASDGLQRDWPAVDSGVDKHYGYAFQWFGLCSLVAILYVWFQLIRRFLRPRSQPSA